MGSRIGSSADSFPTTCASSSTNASTSRLADGEELQQKILVAYPKKPEICQPQAMGEQLMI
jgi:hypothetical protein